jgi:hypothetical protein
MASFFEYGNKLSGSIRVEHQSTFQEIHYTVKLGTWLFFRFYSL